MHKFISIPCILMLLCCSKPVHAQVNDTAIVEEKTVTDDYNVYERGKEIDTTLYFKEHRMPEDSVLSWRNNKSFTYVAYLDSLLKVKEKKNSSNSSKSSSNSPSSSSSPAREQSSSSSSGNSVLSAAWIPYVMWTLAAGFVLFILYNLFLKDSIFKRRKRSLGGTTEEAPVAEEEEISSESDFQRLIRIAATAGNYRLAVRYQYLQSLHLLAGKGHVHLAADKTNYQYVQELKNEKIRNDFAALTLNYEYVWYGEFQIEHSLYQKLDMAFSTFNQRV